MKKLLVTTAAIAALAIPTAASAGGYGKTVKAATGCSYGQLVNLAGGPQNHPVQGVGAKRLVEAVVAGQHPVGRFC